LLRLGDDLIARSSTITKEAAVPSGHLNLLVNRSRLLEALRSLEANRAHLRPKEYQVIRASIRAILDELAYGTDVGSEVVAKLIKAIRTVRERE
jgi:hypothetical protein